MDYTSKIGIALHIIAPLIDYAIEWNMSSSDNVSFPEYYLNSLIDRWSLDIKYKKLVQIGGFQGYSVKYLDTGDVFEEPYQNRVYIWTLVEYDNMSLEFQMNCLEEESEEVELYYNHLLETFKITDSS